MKTEREGSHLESNSFSKIAISDSINQYFLRVFVFFKILAAKEWTGFLLNCELPFLYNPS